MEYKIVDLDKIKNLPTPSEDGSILCADENGKLYFAKLIFPTEKGSPILVSLLLSEVKE